MAVTYDNSAKGSSAVLATTVETTSFAVAGSDRYLLAFVLSGAGTPVDPSAVRWGGSGGTSMTQKGTTFNNGANVKISVWELVAPTAQTSTVHVTWGSNQDEKGVVAISFAGVDQSTPTRTVASANGTDETPTVAATSEAGDLVVDCASWIDNSGNSLTITADASQTSRQEIEGGDLVFEGVAVSTEAAVGVTTTMSWSLPGTPDADWHMFAMALIAAVGGAAGAPLANFHRYYAGMRN